MLRDVRDLGVSLDGGLDPVDFLRDGLTVLVLESFESLVEVGELLGLKSSLDLGIVLLTVLGLTLVPGSFNSFPLSLNSRVGCVVDVESFGGWGLGVLNLSNSGSNGLLDLSLESLSKRRVGDLLVEGLKLLNLRSVTPSFSSGTEVSGDGISLEGITPLLVLEIMGVEGTFELLVDGDGDHGSNIVHGHLSGGNGSESEEFHFKKYLYKKTSINLFQ